MFTKFQSESDNHKNFKIVKSMTKSIRYLNWIEQYKYFVTTVRVNGEMTLYIYIYMRWVQVTPSLTLVKLHIFYTIDL